MSLQGSDAISFIKDYLQKNPYDNAKFYTDFESSINKIAMKDLQKASAQESLSIMINKAESTKDLIAPMLAHLTLGQGEGKAILCLIDMIKANKLYAALRAFEKKTREVQSRLRTTLNSTFKTIETTYFENEGNNFLYVPQDDHLAVYVMAEIESARWALEDTNNYLPRDNGFSPQIMDKIKVLIANLAQGKDLTAQFTGKRLEEMTLPRTTAIKLDAQQQASLRAALKTLSAKLDPSILDIHNRTFRAMSELGATYLKLDDIQYLIETVDIYDMTPNKSEQDIIKMLEQFELQWRCEGYPRGEQLSKQIERAQSPLLLNHPNKADFEQHQARTQLILDTLCKFKGIELATQHNAPEKVAELLKNGAVVEGPTTHYRRSPSLKVKDFVKGIRDGKSPKEALSPPERTLAQIADISGPAWKEVQATLAKQAPTTMPAPVNQAFITAWVDKLNLEINGLKANLELSAVTNNEAPTACYRESLKSIRDFLSITGLATNPQVWAKLDTKINDALNKKISSATKAAFPNTFANISDLFEKLKQGLLPSGERAPSPVAYIPLATEQVYTPSRPKKERPKLADKTAAAHQKVMKAH